MNVFVPEAPEKEKMQQEPESVNPVAPAQDGNKVFNLIIDSFFSRNPFKKHNSVFNLNPKEYEKYISHVYFKVVEDPKRRFYIKLEEPGYIGKYRKILEEDFITAEKKYRMYEIMSGNDAPFDVKVTAVNDDFDKLIKKIKDYNSLIESSSKSQEELQQIYVDTRDRLLDDYPKPSCTITVEDITERVNATRIGEGGAPVRKSHRTRKSRKSNKASKKSKKSGRKSHRRTRR